MGLSIATKVSGAIVREAPKDDEVYGRFNASWKELTFSSSGSFTYVHDYINSIEIIVNHNMDKYPSVTIVDTADTIYDGEVEYINRNSVKVTLAIPMSGRIFCN